MRKEFLRYTNTIDLSKRILEIGPLHAPLIGKEDAENIYYADVYGTEELKEYYRDDPNVNIQNICTVDYVVKPTPSGMNYSRTLKDVEKFDYVISSHVLEHFPRLIEFFLDIVNILRDDGRIYFLIPDHRCCFDAYRQPTSFAEAWYVHKNKLPFPPWRLFDYLLEAAHRHSGSFIGEAKISPEIALPSRASFAEAQAEALSNTEGIPSSHYSVFTPQSFLLLLYNMIGASLLPFRCYRFYPTPKNDLTFAAVLQSCRSMVSDARLQELERAKLAKIMVALAAR